MKNLFLFLLSFCALGFLNAQILTFEFAGNSGEEASVASNSNDSNIQASEITRGNGLNSTTSTDQFAATNWGTTSIAQSVSDDNYMEFSITPNTGYEFSVTSVFIRINRTPTGSIAIALRSSEDNYEANLDQEYAIINNTDPQEFTFTFSQTSNQKITYRIYMYALSNGGKCGIGGGTGNDIIVSGSVNHINSEDQIIIARQCDPEVNYSADRYIEIYNAGDTDLDITGWSLANVQNDVVKFSWTFDGIILAGETWICSDAKTVGQTIDPDVTANWSGAGWNGTGGDGSILKNSSNDTIDYVVQSGTSNEFTDKQMKRKLDIVVSNTTFTPDEWTYVSVSNATDFLPGEHGTVWRNASSNWGTDSNWDNEVPNESSDAFIVSGDTDPNLNIAGVCNDLTIKSGAYLSIPAGQNLTVNGELLNEAGSSGFVLEADISGHASLIHNTNSVSATVKSYFDDIGSGEWYLIGAPTSNATANVFYGEYVDIWNEASGSWMGIEDENDPLNIGQGYSVERTISNATTYEGLLNNGNIDINSVSYTAGDYGGWNLLSNPYPSVLDVEEIEFGSIDAAVHIYQHGSSNSYLSYSKGGTGSNEARYIQPGQGFFVQTSFDNQTLSLTNDMRTNDGLGSFDKNNNEVYRENQLRIELFGFNDRKDEAYLNFIENSTNEFDRYYDAHQFLGSVIQPYVFTYISLEEDEMATINSIPSPNEGDIIHLGTKMGLTGDYELVFNGLNSFESQFEFLLLDKKLDIIVELELDSIYNFQYENGDPVNRFDLLFDLSTTSDQLDEDLISFFQSNGSLYVRLNDSSNEEYEFSIYNLLGQQVYNNHFTDQTNIFNTNLKAGGYIAVIKSSNNYFSHKIILQ